MNVRLLCSRWHTSITLIALEEEKNVPYDRESFSRKGTMVFTCEGEESVAWLEKEVEGLDMGTLDFNIGVVSP